MLPSVQTDTAGLQLVHFVKATNMADNSPLEPVLSGCLSY